VESYGTDFHHRNVSIQLSPFAQHRNIFDQGIKNLKSIINRIEFSNRDKSVQQEITKSIRNLNKLIRRKNINIACKKEIEEVFILLEKLIMQASIEDIEKGEYIKTINILQEEIGQITADQKTKNEECLKFLEKYYEKYKIFVYWGDATKFARELLERWKNYPRN